MVNAHHLSTSQANQRQRRRKNASVRPQVQDSDFGLGEPERRFNRGLEMHALLHQVGRALRWGYCLQTRAGRLKLNSLSGKREKRLEKQIRSRPCHCYHRRAAATPAAGKEVTARARKKVVDKRRGRHNRKSPGPRTATESRTC